MRSHQSWIPLLISAGLALQVCAATSSASDRTSGSQLWLNYHTLTAGPQEEWSAVVRQVFCPGTSAILRNAREELIAASAKLTNQKIVGAESIREDGTVLLGTPAQLQEMLPPILVEKTGALKDGGFLIESTILQGKKCTVILGKDEAGVLYGTFHLLRLMQTGIPADALAQSSEPAIELRMLNHWDNMDGSIERGYGGKSLWKWDELPGQVNGQCHEYARFCASLGINGVVLNNVNADPKILRNDYLKKVAALADVFRSWGIRTYVSVNFASPLLPEGAPGKPNRWRGIGTLDTADPADPAVRAWWTDKAAEIYGLIPDFGGFLVKADSEGMPGPRFYNRSHVDGANMLADALAPHGGTLIWRAFVYDGKGTDRAMEAYDEFKPLDGKFRDNVFLQVKNGPLDFQPREPFTPLFGAMPDTHLAIELQIAKEYLGHSTTLAYLGPMWAEVLSADTHAKGSGSTIAKVIDGSLYEQKKSCIAGVANTGDGAEWCGSIFNQANWYAFGRLAWNPQLGAEEIAEEWICMTIGCDAETRASILKMMMGSYEANVDYSMPLGLNLLVAMSNHYTPSPNTRMSFHKADTKGLGFDRTKQGSNYAGQYHPELQAIFNDPAKTPLEYLLWFHHVPWDAKLSTGRTLWEELVFRYDRGVGSVDQMVETWKALEGKVAPDIHASVTQKLLEEQKFAQVWRDTCVRYFSSFAQQASPSDSSHGPWGPQPQMSPPTEPKSPDQLPFRSWQLQTYDATAREKEGKRIKEIITAAEGFGVNNIQLSHQLVMFAHQLLEQPDDIKLFNECIELAHSKGISVHIWTHEFGGIPDEITKEEKWFDKQPVWDLLESRYSELFEVMPDLDGVVLTFHETEIMVFDVESDMPLAERTAKLINSLHAVCKKHNKTLVVRTFAYEPEQIEGITKSFNMVDPGVLLMTKCVPHDWQVFYPHNPAIGRYPDRMQVIEFDPGAEYYGEGKVPYLYPEYLDFRLQYARERNTHGYVARIERQWDNPCALGGRNEMNLYALKRLAEDPAVTPDQIWKEYITTKAGEGAYVEPLIEAMKLTDDVLNRCYFMLGCWYNNHSDLPTSAYASSRIKRIAKWNPIYKELVSRLDKPDARAVGEVFRESAESVALAKLALSKLEEAKNSGLPMQVYDDYKAQLSDLLGTAEAWAKHRNAYIQERAGGAQPSYDGPFPIGGPARLDLE